MNIVHLTASTFYGGPERQMLGLARALAARCRTTFFLFAEGGRGRAFAGEVRRHEFEPVELANDTPHLCLAIRELTEHLRHRRTDVLCCHGYKANLLGRIAARRHGIPAVAVSRGWTGESFRVRLYERLDRWNLRWMDRVVCVSEGQADKVRRAGVPAERVAVIRNAVRADRFVRPDPGRRLALERMFPRRPCRIVGAAGRLSPEKGFGVLVEAAARIDDPTIGFVLFGDGPQRRATKQRIAALGLTDRFVLAGFRGDLDQFMPFFDVLALPSFTEGLPNVVLEALAAGVPVVATAVGGTPEVVDDGASGYLVPPGDVSALARRIGDVLVRHDRPQMMGLRGRQRILDDFTFEAQARQYLLLFESLTGRLDRSAEAQERPESPVSRTRSASPDALAGAAG
jgi:glycosyltransferase involved in cell wall biosynthesis